jgi:hypothetical protein
MSWEIPHQFTRIYNFFLAAGEIIILWMVIFAQVFSFNRYIGNELDVLAFARQFFNRSWLPNDWYLNLEIGYRQVFSYLLGFTIEWYGFLTGAYIGRIIGYLVLAIALFIFFRSISLRFFLGLIVIILFLENQSLVAGEWIVGGADSKTFAYAFALLAFSFMFKHRYRLGFVFAGAALSAHVLIGIYALFCLTAVLLLTLGSWKDTFTELIRKSWPFFITGIFGLLAIVQQLLPQDRIDKNQAWKIYVEFRLPHHLLPSAWQGETWIYQFVLAAAGFLVVYIFVKDRAARFTAAYALSSILLFCIGLVIFALGHNTWLRFYWFRYADVMIPFLGLVIIALLLNLLANLKVADYPKIGRYFQWIQPLLKYGLPLVFMVLALFLSLDLPGYLMGKYQRGLNRPPPRSQAALEWIERNTPQEALVMVDPFMNESYVYANRARFVSFSHAPQSAADILEWYKRLTYINDNQPPPIPVDKGSLQENFYLLDPNRIEELAAQYRLDFYLGRAGQQLPFEQVYHDEYFTLFKLYEGSQ